MTNCLAMILITVSLSHHYSFFPLLDYLQSLECASSFLLLQMLFFSAWNVWQAKFFSSLQFQPKYLLFRELFDDFQLTRQILALLYHYYIQYLPTLLCSFSPYAVILLLFFCLPSPTTLESTARSLKLITDAEQVLSKLLH